MRRNYTGKFSAGQTVYVNNSRSRLHGRRFVIEAVNSKIEYPYQIDGLWYPESELTADSPIEPPPAARTWETMDIDSELGIGGINNDQAAPFVPSVEAIERVQRMHDTDTVCSRCGASAKFDGAMFSTLGGTNICDDCA